MPAETAVPARRTIQIPAPKAGGDVLIKVVEGGAHIKVTKADPKAEKSAPEDSDDSDFDSDEEEEEKREKIWKIGNLLAEAAIKGVKAGGKVEVTINVLADLGVAVTARAVGGKGGVRGNLKGQ